MECSRGWQRWSWVTEPINRFQMWEDTWSDTFVTGFGGNSNAIRQVENQEDGKEGWGEGKGIEGSDAQLCQHSISTGMKTRGGATHQLPTVPRKEETHATYLHLTLPWNSLQLWNRHNRFGECGCLIQKSIAQQNILKLNIFASSTSPNWNFETLKLNLV